MSSGLVLVFNFLIFFSFDASAEEQSGIRLQDRTVILTEAPSKEFVELVHRLPLSEVLEMKVKLHDDRSYSIQSFTGRFWEHIEIMSLDQVVIGLDKVDDLREKLSDFWDIKVFKLNDGRIGFTGPVAKALISAIEKSQKPSVHFDCQIIRLFHSGIEPGGIAYICTTNP